MNHKLNICSYGSLTNDTELSAAFHCLRSAGGSGSGLNVNLWSIDNSWSYMDRGHTDDRAPV